MRQKHTIAERGGKSAFLAVLVMVTGRLICQAVICEFATEKNM